MTTPHEPRSSIADLLRPELTPAIRFATEACATAMAQYGKVQDTIADTKAQLDAVLERQMAAANRMGEDNARLLVFGKGGAKQAGGADELDGLRAEAEKLRATLAALERLKAEQEDAVIRAGREFEEARREFWQENVDQIDATLAEAAGEVQRLLVLAVVLDRFSGAGAMRYRYGEANLESLGSLKVALIGPGRNPTGVRGREVWDDHPLAKAWHEACDGALQQARPCISLADHLNDTRREERQRRADTAEREAARSHVRIIAC